MTAHPIVPPLKRRRPADELFQPTADKPAPKNRQTMVYLPPEVVADLDTMRADLMRNGGARVDRSALIRAALRLARRDAAQWALETTAE